MNTPTVSKSLIVGEDQDGHRVTLEMEITHHGPEFTTTGQPITHKTIDLEPVTEYDELTISGTSRGSGGQIRDGIRANLDKYTKLYIPKQSVIRILDIWEAHHLGGMNAGTRKQSEALQGLKYDYSQACGALERAGLLVDRGYKYGSLWLKSTLPADVREEIIALFSPETVQPTEPEADSLEAFITKHNLKFECHRVDTRPDGLGMMLDADRMRHFKCRIFARIRTGEHKKSMGLYFSQGPAITEDPTLADVLDCLASDASGYENAQLRPPSGHVPEGKPYTDATFARWAEEYGYEADSRKAEKTFKAIKRQSEQLRRTIGQDAYSELLWDTERL